MNREHAIQTVRWTSGGIFLVGIWLIGASFAFGYAALPGAFWNDITIGIALVVLTLFRIGAPLRYWELARIDAILGVWLMFAAFVLGDPADEATAGAAAMADGTLAAVVAEIAYLNDVIVGIGVLVLAVWGATAGRLPHTALSISAREAADATAGATREPQ
jgi:hypothetical protein